MNETRSADAAPVSTVLKVRKRDGREVEMDPSRIASAITKAFQAELNLGEGQPLGAAIDQDILTIIDQIRAAATFEASNECLSVEQIQDIVEIGLMRREHFHVARRYILYRTDQARLRAVRHVDSNLDALAIENRRPPLPIRLQLEPGVMVPFSEAKLQSFLAAIPESRLPGIELAEVIAEVIRGSFDGMTPEDLARSLVLAARSRIERSLDYDRFAAALQLAILYRQSLDVTQCHEHFEATYRDRFEHYVIEGVRGERLSAELRHFDLAAIAAALMPERDKFFRYLGVQTIYDRYLLHIEGRRIETPQYFWMRVAMGLALREAEDQRTVRAIEFYQLLSSFRFTSATPTLFNSGTRHPQLSSCYLTTVQDDLAHIFKSIGDNAMLSKWAGGLGNDWTSVRATGSLIKGTNGTSQGVIPFLKIVNDAAVAVNQGGKRKGAVCAYLEPWHLDFEEFLDLRKNTGDDRRRTHDMHTAAWIPDLFMQRLQEGGMWTLFSPDEASDLHDAYGQRFRERYEHYEALAAAGKMKQHRRLPAVELWRKLLTRTFETGHPWVTFKDPANIRSPQDHAGVVHSSNLCTEILLNTSPDETAVCNLGSVNLAAHVRDGQLDHTLLEA
ncbi:MAG: ribonucleoside-diphosphate reductase subunit alpha, partial [Novipirellula sp. JB048]